MDNLLHGIRNHIAQLAVSAARRVATDVGWSRTLHGLGSPNMLAGLRLLRARGFVPRRVVDGGACVGDWTRLVRSVFPDAEVLMIEPQQRHLATLKRFCERHAPKVEVAGALVGPDDRDGVPFVVLDDAAGLGTGSSVLAENSAVARHVVTLPMVRLDTLLDRLGKGQPDLIKLDVQGYELEVLKGAPRALRGAEFVLLEVSLAQYNAGSPLLAEVLAWMEASGFRVADVFDLSRRPDGTLLQADLLFVNRDSAFAQQAAEPPHGSAG